MKSSGPETQANKNSKKTIIIVISIAAAFCIAVLVVCLLLFNRGSDDGSELDCELTFEQYVDVKDDLSAIEAMNADAEGYIDSEDAGAVLERMAAVLDEKKDEGVINLYELEDTGVYIELSSGVGYFHSLNIKDLMAGDQLESIISIEPYAYNAELVAQYLMGGRSPDESAKKIVSVLPDDYGYKEVDSFGVDDVYKLANNKVIIWYGHGDYSSYTGPFLGSSTSIIDVSTLFKYSQELRKKELVLGNTRFGITAAFFENHLEENSLKDSIVYLGACLSCKDYRLADALIRKGAKTVIGNTEATFTRYNLYMLTDFFDGMLKITGDGKLNTADQALAYAKSQNGAIDESIVSHGSRVVIRGDGDYRLKQLSEEKPTEKPNDKPSGDSTESPKNPVTFDITEADVEVGTAIEVCCTSGHNLSNGVIKTSADNNQSNFKINILSDRFDIIANHEGTETFTFTSENGDVGTFTLNAIPADKYNRCKRLYTFYLSNVDQTVNNRCALIYLDDDDIPELYLPAAFNAASAKLVWIDDNGELQETILTGRDTSPMYNIKQGKLCTSTFIFGGSTDNNHILISVYELKNHQVDEIFNGSYQGESGFHPENQYDVKGLGFSTVDHDFLIDGESVTGEDFGYSLMGIFDWDDFSHIESKYTIAQAMSAINEL